MGHEWGFIHPFNYFVVSVCVTGRPTQQWATTNQRNSFLLPLPFFSSSIHIRVREFVMDFLFWIFIFVYLDILLNKNIIFVVALQMVLNSQKPSNQYLNADGLIQQLYSKLFKKKPYSKSSLDNFIRKRQVFCFWFSCRKEPSL